MEGGNFDEEMFDLKPILPEIYSTSHDQYLLFSNSTTSHNDHHAITTNSIITSSSSNSFSAKQLIIPSTPQLISFGSSSNTSLLSLPTKSDNKPTTTTTLHEDYSITPQIIKFSSSDQEQDFAANYGTSQQDYKGVISSRTVLQAQDHLIAERKRREKQGQLFINLSKLVPGLKKLDKASLLEDAIKHLRTLKERVSVLEVNKSAAVNNASSIDIACEEAGPEIKARISNSNVLISICCDQKKGLISRIPYELEKMHLNVIDMRAMPFGASALYITILTQMQSEFRGTVKDIVDHLQMIFFSNPRDDLAHFH